ncbi:MAG: porin [Akkermansiaceae bacterium]
MKYIQTKQIPVAIALSLSGLATAGTEITPAPPAKESNNGDFCEWLQNKPGILYKNTDNPFIQEVQIEGRLHYQYAHVQGEDLNGSDFHADYDDVRRFRVGLKAKFLQYFGLKYQVNLVADRTPFTGDLKWGYQSIDEAYVSFNLGKALGNNSTFDSLSLVYGRQKFLFGTEAHSSSNKLHTIERSALSNKIHGSYRPTGLTVKGKKDDWQFAASIYSSTRDGLANEELNGWQDTYSILLNFAYQANDQLLIRSDFSYNDADLTEDTIMGYEWAIGFGAEYDAGSWGLLADVVYGDNGDSSNTPAPALEGSFYAFQITPWMWLIKDKLELVGQYQYQGSDEGAGVRINSRYGRSFSSPIAAIASGRGDSHHSLYGGLNYYVCGHNAKIQAGIEYQTLDAIGGDIDTLTYLVALRTSF